MSPCYVRTYKARSFKDAATVILYDAFDAELFTKPYTPVAFIVSLNNETHCKETLHQSDYVPRRETHYTKWPYATCYNDQ